MTAPAPTPAPLRQLRFTLELRPQTDRSRWCATLVARDSGVRSEFHSPLELVRHLAALSLDHRPGGLR